MPNYQIKSAEVLQEWIADDQRLLQREWDGSSTALAIREVLTIQAELKRREEGGLQETGVQS